MRNESIDRIMSTDLTTIAPDAPLVEARHLLESRRIHHLPVVEDGRLIGILSSADLLKFLLLDDDASVMRTVAVRRVMQPDPETLPSDASLRDAASALSDGGRHALPVVDADGALAGIVTSSDLMRHLARRLPSEEGNRESAGPLRADDMATALAQIDSAIAGGELDAVLGDRLRRVVARSGALLEVVDAAERFIRSGQAGHEHGVLVRKLERLHREAPPLGL